MRTLAVLVGLAGLVAVGAASSVRATAAAPAPGSFRQTSFDTDPHWEGLRNLPGPNKCTRRTFIFGWSENAGGRVGGTIERSSYYPAYYAKVLAGTKTLDDTLTVSGTLRVGGESGGGALLGWFNSRTSVDWRTPDFLGLRINGQGKKTEISVEYGTTNTFTQFVPGAVVRPRAIHDWTLEYVPDAGTYGAGLIRLTFDGTVAELSLKPEHHADGAVFDRFGFLNVQLDGASMTAHVERLTLDGEVIDLTSDPGWEGFNNTLSKAEDCYVRHRENFGYSATQFAGGAAGEIGGIVWRSSKGKPPASYADTVGNLGFEDVLYAEGSISLERASSDSDVFIGWFNSASASRDGALPTNILAANLGGPSEWGYRLTPVYRSRGDKRDSLSGVQNAPRATPKHHPWRWWICYVPAADPLVEGRLTVGIEDPGSGLPPTQTVMMVKKGARKDGAVFNRFGIRNFEAGGHSIVFYLDDLRYTTGPGDAGPPERCGT